MTAEMTDLRPVTSTNTAEGIDRQTDIARIAALIGDNSRTRILQALCDGRALPASILAAEAGVSAPTVSAHLSKLVDAGLITVEPNGRHRYYRLAGPQVSSAIEALAVIAPPLQVTSLRESTRAGALRRSRTCYDHLAGRLGVELMRSMLDGGLLDGHDGVHRPERAVHDRLSSYGQDIQYRLTDAGQRELAAFGVRMDDLPKRRPAVRYCVDWSEQRHHLSGSLGAALTTRLFDLGWLRRGKSPRVVHLTEAGAAGMGDVFGMDVAA